MATYYISPTGNNTTGDGSSGNPWLTVTKAITSSTLGDTIVLKDGTYTSENVTITGYRTIQAQNNGLAIFEGASAAMLWTAAIPGNTLTIQGIVFQNITYPNSSSQFLLNYVNCTNNPTFTFVNCTFKNIRVSSTFCSGIIGASQAHSQPTALNATNCIFDNISSQAAGNPAAIFSMGFGGGGTGILNLTNCTMYFKTGGSNALNAVVFAEQRPITVTTKNCIVMNSSGTTIKWSQTSDGGSVSNAATYSDFNNINSNPTGTGVITSDPLFVDAANGNFNLRPTSPCIDTGTLS